MQYKKMSLIIILSNEMETISVLLEKEYGIKLASPAEGKEIFKSVRTIAEYVSKNRKK